MDQLGLLVKYVSPSRLSHWSPTWNLDDRGCMEYQGVAPIAPPTGFKSNHLLVIRPINISLCMIMCAASLPFYRHSNRYHHHHHHQSSSSSWNHCLCSGLYTHLSIGPHTRRCLSQIVLMQLQVMWQSCLWGDVSSLQLQQVWTC